MVLLRRLLLPFGVIVEHPALPPGFLNRMELLKWKRIDVGEEGEEPKLDFFARIADVL